MTRSGATAINRKWEGWPAMSTNNQESARGPAPRGSAAVRDALIDATERLCAERSPARVSVRDIAAEAGVNHGQVHHYFGSKEGLIASTLERLDAGIAEQVITGQGLEPSRLVGAATLRPGFLRLLAWALLEGDGRPQIGDLRFGRMLIERLREEGLSKQDAGIAATQVMAIAGGWALLEPALMTVNQLSEEEARAVSSSLGAVVESVLSTPARDQESERRATR
jgi:TetR/AcrR family transcriptional regulator, repressor for neighboring sulfatase